ncbi:unnamed protein product [Protopolystoma xenopodis]|uniref:Uncharacterized protein n=1 Tax=Protopolystoma xenopodis TaxID=117903 RepID=A0A3S4ZNT0_9PLAT|nr:unnamed protein product [Protopolystoma xenopodis]
MLAPTGLMPAVVNCLHSIIFLGHTTWPGAFPSGKMAEFYRFVLACAQLAIICTVNLLCVCLCLWTHVAHMRLSATLTICLWHQQKYHFSRCLQPDGLGVTVSPPPCPSVIHLFRTVSARLYDGCETQAVLARRAITKSPGDRLSWGVEGRGQRTADGGRRILCILQTDGTVNSSMFVALERWSFVRDVPLCCHNNWGAGRENSAMMLNSWLTRIRQLQYRGFCLTLHVQSVVAPVPDRQDIPQRRLLRCRATLGEQASFRLTWYLPRGGADKIGGIGEMTWRKEMAFPRSGCYSQNPKWAVCCLFSVNSLQNGLNMAREPSCLGWPEFRSFLRAHT